MWTLAPGLVASSLKGWGELRSLATGERWELRPEDLPIVRALAIGIPEKEEGAHRELQAAVKLGWAEQAESTADARVRQRLEALERRFAWCRSAAPAAAHEAILAAQTTRRHLHRGLGHWSALPETVARRAALVGDKPRKVLVLGDDDFLGVGLATLGHQVTVLEIDTAIAELIHRANGRIEVIAHDLREPFPTALIGAFDAFFADPVSGVGALRMFLARGLTALRPAGSGFICVSEAGAQTFKTVTAELGSEVTEHYSDFNHYYGLDYQLAPYVSDLATLRRGDEAAIKPRPEEPYLVRSLNEEDHFLETPATRYAFKNINPETTQLIHIDAAIQTLESIGRLQVGTRSFYHDDIVHSYVVHTKQGTAILVRIVPGARVGELFVAPADSKLEDALIVVLLGALGIEGTVVQKHRVRGSSIYTLV